MITFIILVRPDAHNISVIITGFLHQVHMEGESESSYEEQNDNVYRAMHDYLRDSC